ncbi:MAG: hypothetical protein R3F59_29575 [Myxococcota bacterium]
MWRGDGAPAWKRFTDGILVGVAVGVDVIVTIDAEGQLVRWRRTDGEKLDRQHVPGPTPRDLRLTDSGVIGVLDDDGVTVLAPAAAPQRIHVAGAAAFSFGPGGGSVGVGTTSGRFTAIELATGGRVGRARAAGRRARRGLGGARALARRR